MEFASAFHHAIILWHRTGADSNGDHVFAAPVQVYGRWEDVSELFLDQNGAQAVSKGRFYCGPSVTVGGEDRVLLGVLDSDTDTYPPADAVLVRTTNSSCGLSDGALALVKVMF